MRVQDIPGIFQGFRKSAMIHLGLVGYPITHSLSPALHERALRACGIQGEYKLYPVEQGNDPELSDMAARMKAGEINGLNVTIPYKQSIIPYLDRMTRTAKAIGAVNTLFLHSNELIGDNTDAAGFLADISMAFQEKFEGKQAIVMGAGGAARAVVFALLSTGWQVTLAVRRTDVEQARVLTASFQQIEDTKQARIILLEEGEIDAIRSSIQLIVNATPVGMWPEVGNSPWPKNCPFPHNAAVYDLVYNPRETAFIMAARKSGLQTGSGVGMLVEQARLSFQKWTGCTVPRGVMLSALEAQ
jgi:shikimate dehydrogenase